MMETHQIYNQKGVTVMADMRIGKFTVVGTLGKGAHSTILKINRREDGRDYALKVVPIDDSEDLKFLEQARHEFRVAQMLSHPNLIKIFALETEKNWFFRVKKVSLLIEFVNGATLDKVPPMPVAKLLPILQKIADGMVHMHRRGIWHADMKPNNVILGKKREVKILDYGLAWIKGEVKDRIQGTPEYIAPETALRRVVNERTDIFNFGATMYRLVAMRVPPSAMPTGDTGKISEKTWNSLLKPATEYNATCPGSLNDLIMKCMSFNPEKRPERMTSVQESLTSVAEELGIGDELDDE